MTKSRYKLYKYLIDKYSNGIIKFNSSWILSIISPNPNYITTFKFRISFNKDATLIRFVIFFTSDCGLFSQLQFTCYIHSTPSIHKVLKDNCCYNKFLYCKEKWILVEHYVQVIKTRLFLRLWHIWKFKRFQYWMQHWKNVFYMHIQCN